MLDRHGRRADHGGPRLDIAHDAALRANPCAFANVKVPGEAGLAGDNDRVIEFGASGDSGLGDDHAPAPQLDVVPDLHQIINHAAGTDYGVRARAPVDRGVGADFDVVMDDHAADLGDAQVAVRPGGEAEPLLPDAHAGVDHDPVADQTVA